MTRHCWAADSTFLVLHVIDTDVVLDIKPKYWEHALNKAETQKRALAGGLAEKIKNAQPGLPVEEMLLQKHLKDLILDAASDWGADLVVLGSRGHRGLTRFLLKSVSQAVASHAPCSVLVVRPVPVEASAKAPAAAALVAAAERQDEVCAVVSRGGRPDLAGEAVSQVRAPTLLIVGGHDDDVILLNERAFGKLQCTKKLEIVPGATHLFAEEGALERVAELARQWFDLYLVTPFP